MDEINHKWISLKFTKPQCSRLAMHLLAVDNDRLLLDALRLAIELRKPDVQVDVAGSIDEALTYLQATAYEVVLLDWWLGAKPSSEFFAAIQDLNPEARIVVMSGDDRVETLRCALDIGAAGYIRKGATDVVNLRHAIDLVLQGGIYLPSDMPGRTPGNDFVAGGSFRSVEDCFPQLTKRQADVLRVLLRGASDKLIARQLDVATSTVKTHLQEIYRRINVSSRAEALTFAARIGVRIE